jgi:hypothetical protein
MNAYNLVLSDGKHVRVEAQSAADAIAVGLNTYRGRRVEKCFQGFEGQSASYGVIGGTHYDVSPHNALPETVEAKRERRTEDTKPFPFFK